MFEIIGKNGSGKTYLTNKLREFGFNVNVGYTTRKKREGEVDGIDYNFITISEFEEKIKNGEFIDYKYRNGNYYGIAKDCLCDNTILISGSSKKIEEATGNKISKIYINCDLMTRYLRVLERKDLLKNNFDRFHQENFSFLNDFDAVFIENDNSNNNSLDMLVKIVSGSDNQSVMTNKEFIEKKLEDESYADSSIIDEDKLLIMLMYEEYLLRKFFLETDDIYDEKLCEKYYAYMSKFAQENGIECFMNDSGLNVEVDNQNYVFDFKIKRLVK